ncbi:MAG: glycosyltransferase 87 family protein [Actinomycetota bacterium]|nr:glycosyltransferase 87 family protein [Actinomycetota bacterium]
MALVALAVLMAFGWAARFSCLRDGTWTGGEQFRWACYTDMAPLWFGRGLDDGAVPYLDADLEYPVLIGAQIHVTATLASEAGEPVVAFFNVNALLNALAAVAVLVVVATSGASRGRQLRWAIAPVVVTSLFTNWDVVAVLALVAGIELRRRSHDGAAGIAAGLGAAVKLFPAVLVPVVVADLVARGERRRAVRHAAAAAAAWSLVNLPVAFAAPAGWWRFYELSIERSAHWNSIWTALGHVGAGAVDPNGTSAAAFLAGAAAIMTAGVLWVAPGERWRTVLPLVCWFLVTTKVYSPQYSLWVAGLVALVPVATRPVVAFFAIDAATYVVELLFLGGRAGFSPAPTYDALAVLVLLRAAALLWIGVDAFRTAAQRQESNVRRASTADTGSSTPVSTG